MFEILLTACLVSQPDICAERILPSATPTLETCQAGAPERTAAWAAAKGLRPEKWRCLGPDDFMREIEPLDVADVADGVFVHKGLNDIPTPENAGDLANLAFIVGAEAVAVIDAGGSRAVGEQLYAAIRDHTNLPIRWLVLTHMHPDHTLGASVFQEAGARVVGHEKLGSALANRAQAYGVNIERLLGPRGYLGTEVVVPDAGPMPDEINLGERVLELKAYPTAHTDNDITVLDRQTGTLFTGDLVFAVHTPALDGSILGWQRVLASISETHAQRIVPGHGPVSLPWPEGAEATWGYLAALTEETRSAIRRGESMHSAIEHLGESQRPFWQLFDEFNPRNATAAYKELEWE